MLISQLLMVLVAVELLRSGRTDPLLCLVLGLIKLGLVADCISILTLHMRRLSGSSSVLAFLLCNVPIVTGPSAELALAMHALRENKSSTTNMFLMGSVYAKALAMGASCLILQGLRARIPGIDMQAESPIVPWVLGVSGVLILASAPHIDSKYRVRCELRLLTRVIGDNQWISQGVPLFLILHAGFSYYFGTWRAARHKRRVEDGRVSMQKSNSIAATREWVALLVCLGTLKAGAVLLVGGLLDQAHALALHSETRNNLLADGAFIDFTVLPLATAALDHLTDLKIAHEGDVISSWANLIQSTLQTYFFVRPLATLAGHDIDPKDGRVGIGLCFLAIASWLSLPVVPRRFRQTTRCETSN
jgi:Ca2+/H+ antiporter